MSCARDESLIQIKPTPVTRCDLTVVCLLQSYVPTVFENYTATFDLDVQRAELRLWDTSGRDLQGVSPQKQTQSVTRNSSEVYLSNLTGMKLWLRQGPTSIIHIFYEDSTLCSQSASEYT